MGISKRLAVVISGAAFAGGVALTMGAAAPANAAPVPASSQTLVNHIFNCGCWGCCDDCWDDCDDWGW